MSKKILIQLFFLLSIAFCFGKKADAETLSGGIEYQISSGKVTITGYSGNSENIVVPATIKGYKIESINASAFLSCKQLLSVDLSKTSIVTVPDRCFFSCSNLTKVSFPDSLRKIENNAFAGCTSLKNVALTSFISEIGEYAFYDCHSLAEVKQNSVCLKEIGKFAFYNTQIKRFVVPANCHVGNNAINIDESTTIITSNQNDSVLQQLKGCNITCIEDFQVSVASETVVTGVSGQKHQLVLNSSNSNLFYVWEQKNTAQLLAREKRYTVTVRDGRAYYICHVSNGVYTHDIQFSVTGSSVPPKVYGVNLEEKNGKVLVSWKKASGVKGYIVYRSNKRTGTYKKLGKTSKLQFKDGKVKFGKTYYYKVKAYKIIASKKVYGSLSGFKKLKILGIPSTPKLSIKKNKYVTWEKKKASGVVIYVKSKGVWLKVKSLSFSKYKQRSIKISARTVSAVKVRLYKVIKNKKKNYRVYSKYSNVVKM